ncbi:MAG: peptide ABC transporter substrate-binding protein [Deltaproteobacteria bacterium]|nr:peptide ABC transporter substrate-binding protein [Deltaproteobacteria bacterium]
MAAARAGEPFTFRLQADPATLDWTHAHTNYETYVLMNIMEGLVEIDRAQQPQPGLAARWEVSEDGLTYTFYLRPGVKWSDGTLLKSQDFVYSWHRLLSPSNTSEYSSYLFEIKNAEAFHQGKIKKFDDVGIRMLDAQTIQIKLRRVVSYFPTLLSFWVTFPQREPMNAQHPVTLGPYLLTKWEQGREMIFERNPGYYGARPQLEKVRAIIEPDDKAARKLLQDGKIDALLEVNTQDIANSSRDVLRQFDYLAVDYLAMNVAFKPLSDLNLRRAIALALDRGNIGAVLSGGQQAADSLVPKGLAGYDPATSLPPSIDGARQAVLKAGYRGPTDVPSLSIVARKGVQAQAAEYVRDILKARLGLAVTVNAVEPGEFKKYLKSSGLQLYIGHWGADYPDASSFMEVLLSTSVNNYTRWRNPAYDQLVREAGDSTKVWDRLTAYSEAQKILMRKDVVVVPLYYPKIAALVSHAVSAFEITPLNYLFFKRIVRP